LKITKTVLDASISDYMRLEAYAHYAVLRYAKQMIPEYSTTLQIVLDGLWMPMAKA